MRVQWFLALVLAVVALFPLDARAQTSHPGFGDDERAPTGAPFILPPGLEIAGPIVGADDDGNCPQPSTDAAGSGLWVRVCVPVKNRTGGPVNVVFPPGLVIVAALESHQHGLMIERTVLTVPPVMPGPGRLRDKEEKDIIYVPLHLYCMNSEKEYSTPGAPYALGPVSQHPVMGEVAHLLEGKNLRGRDRVEIVQNVVWDAIKAGAITPQIREDIASIDQAWLPD